MLNISPKSQLEIYKISELEATKSHAQKRKVGAIIFSDKMELLSTGFNFSMNRESPQCEQGSETFPYVIHAEETALLNLGKNYSQNMYMAVTQSPCLQCAMRIAAVPTINAIFINNLDEEKFFGKGRYHGKYVNNITPYKMLRMWGVGIYIWDPKNMVYNLFEDQKVSDMVDIVSVAKADLNQMTLNYHENNIYINLWEVPKMELQSNNIRGFVEPVIQNLSKPVDSSKIIRIEFYAVNNDGKLNETPTEFLEWDGETISISNMRARLMAPTWNIALDYTKMYKLEENDPYYMAIVFTKRARETTIENKIEYDIVSHFSKSISGIFVSKIRPNN